MLTKAKVCPLNELLGHFACRCRVKRSKLTFYKMSKREGSDKRPPRAFSLSSRVPPPAEPEPGGKWGQVRFFHSEEPWSSSSCRCWFCGCKESSLHVWRTRVAEFFLQHTTLGSPEVLLFFFFFFFPPSLSFWCLAFPRLTASTATVHLVNKLCCAENRTAQTCFYFDMPYFTPPPKFVHCCFVFLKLLQNVSVHGLKIWFFALVPKCCDAGLQDKEIEFGWTKTNRKKGLRSCVEC